MHCNVPFSRNPLGGFPYQLKPYRLPHVFNFPAHPDWWVLLGHSHIPLPKSSWIFPLTFPHLALHSGGWLVTHAVFVLTVHRQCIQYWVWRPLFCSAVRCWCRSHIWCQHGVWSSPMSYSSVLLSLSDHNRRRCFQMHCIINLYFYLM